MAIRTDPSSHRIGSHRHRIPTALLLVLFIVLVPASPAARARQFAYVTNFDDGTVSVIDTVKTAVTATIPVGDGPLGVAITPDGAAVYVANFRSDTVSVIDSDRNRVIATIPVSGAPNSVAIAPDGGFAYVTDTYPGGVSVIDTATNTIALTIAVQPQAAGIAIAPNGRFAYVTHFTSAALSVIDTVENRLDHVILLNQGIGQGPISVAIAPNGLFAYVANYVSQIIFDLSTASGGLRRFFVSDIIPEAVAISPDSAFAYVVGDYPGSSAGVGALLVFDTAAKRMVAEVTILSSPEALAVSPDGAELYVARTAGDKVSVISTAQRWITDTIPVGKSPMGVAVADTTVPGDANCDRKRTESDIGAVIEMTFNPQMPADCPGVDQNYDGVVNAADLAAVLAAQ